MSHVALATDAFEAMTRFYGEVLDFPVTSEWDRPTGRGKRFDLSGGLRLEILDNRRERSPLLLGSQGDRLHVVVEVEDIEARTGGSRSRRRRRCRGARGCSSCAIRTACWSPSCNGTHPPRRMHEAHHRRHLGHQWDHPRHPPA